MAVTVKKEWFSHPWFASRNVIMVENIVSTHVCDA